jgi:hypothetical protein
MRILGLAAVIVLAASGGCAFGSAGGPAVSTATTSGPGHTVALTRYRGHGITFAYPETWSHRRPGFLSTAGDGIVDLGTQPLTAPCRTRGNVTACDWPVRLLRAGGVVVRWTIDELPAPNHRPPAGLHVKVSRPGYCSTVGGTETVSARLVTSRHEVYLVDACLRGPRLASNERAVRAMLASARAR